MKFKRTKASEDVVGPKAIDLTYNDLAGAQKVMGPIIGKLKYIGALSSAQRLEQGKLVAVYNNAAAAGFITMGDPLTIVAPSSPSTGIPCAPNSYTIFAMGSDTGIIGSAATLFAYEVCDESNYSPS